VTPTMSKTDLIRCRDLAVLAAVLVALAAAGCQMPAAAGRPSSATIDLCADRLHELSGRLLLYYSLHQELPPTLEDLRGVDPAPMPPAVCPTSGRPYVYNRAGVKVPGRDGLAVIYDWTPVHAGMRWCILVEKAAPGEPLTARVLLVPDLPAFSGGETPAARLPAMESPPKR
jgi:hypothetical protein